MDSYEEDDDEAGYFFEAKCGLLCQDGYYDILCADVKKYQVGTLHNQGISTVGPLPVEYHLDAWQLSAHNILPTIPLTDCCS